MLKKRFQFVLWKIMLRLSLNKINVSDTNEHSHNMSNNRSYLFVHTIPYFYHIIYSSYAFGMNYNEL